MKATKANLIKLAKSHGVTDSDIDNCPNLSPMGFDITFYLPKGKCWASDGEGTHCIVASQWEDETRAECIQDAMDRMNYGTEDCNCECCKSP